MFKQVVKTVKKMIDPYGGDKESYVFDDPLASTIDWKPLNKGGTSMQTHKLVMVNADRMEFKPASGAVLFGVLLVLVGIGIVSGVVYYEYMKNALRMASPIVIASGIGLIFAVFGAKFIYSIKVPIVFDRMYGHYWKGWVDSVQGVDFNLLKVHVPLREIHALQVIAEFCKGQKSSYLSYELNIVKRDGSRLNVVDHGCLKAVRDDAKQLAEFLRVPLWEGL